jgi:FHS family L-fucose permease-like MFS transporter
LAVLAIAIYFVKMPEVHEEETNVDLNYQKQKQVFFSFHIYCLGALAIFFYVGVEVISYDTFAGFGEHLGYPLDVARNFATYTGYALLAGYVFNIVCYSKIFIATKSHVLA